MNSRVVPPSLVVSLAFLLGPNWTGESWAQGAIDGPADTGALTERDLVPWEGLGGIQLSEILFGPVTWDGDPWCDEYIELHHHAFATEAAVDLSGWAIESQSGSAYVFPEGIQIPPDTFLVVALGNCKGVPCDKWGPQAGGFYAGPGDTVPPAYKGTKATSLDEDGTIVICAFEHNNLFLGDDHDFVVLRDASGKIVDAVGYWSGGAKPYGPVYEEAVACGEWFADDFHLHTFSILVDDVGIARTSYIADLNAADEWYDGMRVGPTPGKDNDENSDDDTVLGWVIGSDGNGIPGVSVRDPITGSGTATDGNGHFELANMPPGSYDLFAEKNGYITNVRPLFHKSPHLMHRVTFGLMREDELDAASAVIDANGGVLYSSSFSATGPDWFVTFPAGALSQATAITVTALPAEDGPLSVVQLEDQYIGDNQYRIVERLRSFEFQPEGLVFPSGLEPIVVSRYDGDEPVEPGDQVRVISVTGYQVQVESPGVVIDGGGTLHVQVSIPHFSEYGMITAVNGWDSSDGVYAPGPITYDSNGDGKLNSLDQRECVELCPGQSDDISFEKEVCTKTWSSSTGTLGGSISAKSGQLVKFIANVKGTVHGQKESSEGTENQVCWTVSTKKHVEYTGDEGPPPDKQEVCVYARFQKMLVWFPGGGFAEILMPDGTGVTVEVIGHCE